MTRKMLSKTLISVSVLALLAQSAIANTGFYGGAAVGAAALTGDSKLSLGRVFLGAADRRSLNFDLSAKNIDGDLFIGYGKRLNCFWLAIEAIASFTSLRSKNTLDLDGENSGENLTTKTTNAGGGSVNLGYYINPTSKLYIKLGIESRRFSVNFVEPIVIDPFFSLNKSYRSTAFVPGLGMDVEINPRFSVRTEYRIALHRKKTVQDNNLAAAFPLFTNIQAKPTIHYFNVGFVVKI
jgi:opacity protein-like surface antigen